jgi:hypothetical protein
VLIVDATSPEQFAGAFEAVRTVGYRVVALAAMYARYFRGFPGLNLDIGQNWSLGIIAIAEAG